MSKSLFDLQKSPEIITLEQHIGSLESQKTKVRTQLKRQKTTLQSWQEDIVETQRAVFNKASTLMEKYEAARMEIIQMCEKLLKNKKVAQEDKDEISKIHSDFEEQNFSMDEMRRMHEAENENHDEEAPDFDFFKSFREMPEHTEKRDIRKIFMRLANQFHPDKARNEKDKALFHRLMQRINQAYKNHDVETLLDIEAQYGEVSDYSLQVEVPDAEDHLETLKKRQAQLEQELLFLENQLERVKKELKKIKSSEPAQMVKKKKQFEKQKKDWLEAMVEDLQKGLDQLELMKKNFEEAAKSGDVNKLLSAEGLDVGLSDAMLDQMVEEFLASEGRDMENISPFEIMMMKEMIRSMFENGGEGMPFGFDFDTEDGELYARSSRKKATTQPKARKKKRKPKAKARKKKK